MTQAEQDKMTGVQVQAVLWAAYKDGQRPPKRALEQMAELGLVTAPTPGHDPHWRATDEGHKVLRAKGLSRTHPASRTMFSQRARDAAK